MLWFKLFDLLFMNGFVGFVEPTTPDEERTAADGGWNQSNVPAAAGVTAGWPGVDQCASQPILRQDWAVFGTEPEQTADGRGVAGKVEGQFRRVFVGDPQGIPVARLIVPQTPTETFSLTLKGLRNLIFNGVWFHPLFFWRATRKSSGSWMILDFFIKFISFRRPLFHWFLQNFRYILPFHLWKWENKKIFDFRREIRFNSGKWENEHRMISDRQSNNQSAALLLSWVSDTWYQIDRCLGLEPDKDSTTAIV